MNALAIIDPIRRAREAHAKFFPPARPVNLVADALAREAKRRVKLTPFQRALEDIAAKHGISQADILGPSKAWPAVRARTAGPSVGPRRPRQSRRSYAPKSRAGRPGGADWC